MITIKRGPDPVLDFLRGTAQVEAPPTVLTISYTDWVEGRRVLRDIRWRFFLPDKGSATAFIVEPGRLLVLPGDMVYPESGYVRLSVAPSATFYDFAMWEDDSVSGYQSQDPAIRGAIVSDNQGELSPSGTGTAWKRYHRVVYPPKGTAFAVPFLTFRDVPAGSSQYLDGVQIETMRYTTNTVSAYQKPRAITAFVAPSRMNLCTKPARVTQTATGRLEQSTLTGMLPGALYTASVEWRPVTDGSAMTLTMEFGEASLDSGNVAPETGAEQGWRRHFVRFFAYSRVDNLALVPSNNTEAYEYRHVLVERADSVGTWFDGDSGSDFVWQTARTPNVDAVTLFYQDRAKRNYLLRTTLRDNVAVGVPILDPEYGTNRTPFLSSAYGSGPYGSGVFGG